MHRHEPRSPFPSLHRLVKEIVLDYPCTSLSFYHDGITVMAGMRNGFINVYDLRKSVKPMHSFQAHTDSPVYDIQFQRVSKKAPSSTSVSRSSSSVSTPSHQGRHTSSTVKDVSKVQSSHRSGIRPSFIFLFLHTPCRFLCNLISSLPWLLLHRRTLKTKRTVSSPLLCRITIT
jgi:hypothetical protein